MREVRGTGKNYFASIAVNQKESTPHPSNTRFISHKVPLPSTDYPENPPKSPPPPPPLLSPPPNHHHRHRRRRRRHNHNLQPVAAADDGELSRSEEQQQQQQPAEEKGEGAEKQQDDEVQEGDAMATMDLAETVDAAIKYPPEAGAAVVAIQAVWRGFFARKAYEEERVTRQWAAVKVQSFFRARKARRFFAKRMRWVD